MCSAAEVTRWLPFRFMAWAAPLIARLFDSVAPEVKMISLGFGPDRAGDLFAGLLDRLAGLPAKPVRDAGRVAVDLREIRQHRLDNPRVGPRRRMVVEIDGQVQHDQDSSVR